MDYTSRMVALLGELRRERNGAVADAMSLCGKPYGLNYGVSLPTLRRIARAEKPDHDFARYLYVQDVRELRLAALHVAQAERVTIDEADFWAAGIINSEVAEEASFALLSRIGVLSVLFERWMAASPLLQYAVLLAAARSPLASPLWAVAAVEAVHRNAVSAAGAGSVEAGSVVGSVAAGSSASESAARLAHLTAQGAAALLVSLAGRGEKERGEVLRAAETLGTLPAEEYLRGELAWRLAY